MSSADAPCSRRDALRRFSAAMAFIAAHEALASSSGTDHHAGGEQGTSNQPTALPLIKSLRLLTAVPLARMREFYHERIGFEVLEDTEAEITFKTGTSTLTFVPASADDYRAGGGRGGGEPFYHFAFNIPQNTVLAARAWQRERSELVPTPETLRDPAYPDDVRHFRTWNAHSLFFFDPAYNIVEYIARHDMKNDSATPDSFDTKDILYISEIGFVFELAENTGDRDVATKLIHDKLGLNAYPRGTNDWWAMGDERGLLLCLANKGRTWGENTDTPVQWECFPAMAEIQGNVTGEVKFEGYEHRIQVG